MDEDRDIIYLFASLSIQDTDLTTCFIKREHIGDVVKPSERRKGVFTKMIGLAILECRSLGTSKVLLTCRKDNIPPAKSIINNGGII